MSWKLLPHPCDVRVRQGSEWLDAIAWAINNETGELDVTMGRRMTRRGDRPGRSELRRIAPADWLAQRDRSRAG